MNVTSKISVDMTRQNVGQRVNAVQGDGNTRLVEITLLSGGAPWTPPEGVEAAIAYTQPGGTKGLYNKLADGTAAISISGNVATVILAPQMLTASGTVQASLVFNDAQLNRLTTFPFAVSVTSNPAAGAQKVEDYLRLQWLEDKLEEYLSAIKASGVFDGKPGDNGVTFTPSVSENGDISWRNNGGLPNPQTVNIRGPQGDSKEATAAANAAQTSAANAETHAADAAASAAAAQKAVGVMGTELSQIKDDLNNLNNILVGYGVPTPKDVDFSSALPDTLMSKSGSITASNGYSLLAINLNAGEILTVNLVCATIFAAFSKVDVNPSTNRHDVIEQGKDDSSATVTSEYIYTATEDIDLYICYKSSVTPSGTISVTGSAQTVKDDINRIDAQIGNVEYALSAIIGGV